jgi:hypothetical protein
MAFSLTWFSKGGQESTEAELTHPHNCPITCRIHCSHCGEDITHSTFYIIRNDSEEQRMQPRNYLLCLLCHKAYEELFREMDAAPAENKKDSYRSSVI